MGKSISNIAPSPQAGPDFGGPVRSARRKALQAASILLVSAIALLYAFEGFWFNSAYSEYCYILSGLLGVCLLALCVLSARLYARFDTVLLAFFLAFAWLSSIYAYGLSLGFFHSRFLCVWMVFIALYYAVQIVPDPQKLMRWFSSVFSLALSGTCLSVLLKASRSLFSAPPGHDTVGGCFQLGRLCGLSNANYFAFSCVALIMISVFGWLNTGKRVRLLYLPAALLGWLCLGLTGCRTGVIGVAFSFALLTFSCAAKRRRASGAARTAASCIALLLASLLVLILTIESFLLPVHLYRGLMTLWGRLSGQEQLLQNLPSLVVRRVSDNTGTMADRFITWSRTLQLCLKNTRRFLLGISPLSNEIISGVYEGHHEIPIPHAHSVYLELLRVHGLIGFLIWMALLFSWGERGVRLLFRGDAGAPVDYLIAAAAGILVMGLAEPVPFLHESFHYTSIPFFLICGYCSRAGEDFR